MQVSQPWQELWIKSMYRAHGYFLQLSLFCVDFFCLHTQTCNFTSNEGILTSCLIETDVHTGNFCKRKKRKEDKEEEEDGDDDDDSETDEKKKDDQEEEKKKKEKEKEKKMVVVMMMVKCKKKKKRKEKQKKGWYVGSQALSNPICIANNITCLIHASSCGISVQARVPAWGHSC